jgi:hypothetical protein
MLGSWVGGVKRVPALKYPISKRTANPTQQSLLNPNSHHLLVRVNVVTTAQKV